MDILSRTSTRSEEKEIINVRFTKAEHISFLKLILEWCPSDDREKFNAQLATTQSSDKQLFTITIEIFWTCPENYQKILNFLDLT